MSSLLSGIHLALSALQANQAAIEVTEHNVANASTPGYRRQIAVMGTGVPYGDSEFDNGRTGLIYGTGSQLEQVRRMANTFVDARYRAEAGDASRWEAQSGALQPLEAVLNETSTSGLTAQLDQFFRNWQGVASDPQNIGQREVLLTQAEGLTSAFRYRAQLLDAARRDVTTEISHQVDQLNELAGQVAALNEQIAQQAAAGNQPNDLLDRRDALLDELGTLSNIQSFQQANGEVLVSLNGHVLIASNVANKLEFSTDPTSGDPVISWSGGPQVQIASGKIAGLVSAASQTLPDLRSNLDTLAHDFADAVNDLHSIAYGLDNQDGRPFFNGDSASTIAVHPDLIGQPRRVAASGAVDAPGDNSAARAISNLSTSKLMDGGTQSFIQYYNQQMTRLGMEIKTAGANARQHQSATAAINQQRESLSGVSLDEEAANMVRYQRSYQAATRLMTVVDEMLDTIINGMGVVGR